LSGPAAHFFLVRNFSGTVIRDAASLGDDGLLVVVLRIFGDPVW
jgi:hypothetical protein